MGVIRTIVSGYGYWGEVLTRNLLADPAYFVAGVHDPSASRREAARSANLYTFRTLQDALDFVPPDLVVIASPIGTQYEAALMALSRHANVMMAKPGVMRVADLESIDALARRKRRVAVIDYTMRHAAPFRRMLDASDKRGNIVSVEAERFSVGTRSTASILSDVMVHDIALLHALSPQGWRVASVDAGDHHLFVHLETDDAAAILKARTDATEPRRWLRVTGTCDSGEWNQLVTTSDQTPLQLSLKDMSRRITSGDHDMNLEHRVTATLQEISAA